VGIDFVPGSKNIINKMDAQLIRHAVNSDFWTAANRPSATPVSCYPREKKLVTPRGQEEMMSWIDKNAIDQLVLIQEL
jgi:hypothetical protein